MVKSALRYLYDYIRKFRPKPQLEGSRYLASKDFFAFRIVFSNFLGDFTLIFLGAISAGFGLKGFLLPNSFIDGGITGISLLTTNLTGISFSIFILLFNIPFIILGMRQISKTFAIKSILAISFLAIVVYFVNYPVITNDKLLVAVFGGFFLGAGIGLAVRGGAVIDGSEVLAIFLSRKWNRTIGDIIWVINIGIFSVAAYLLTIEIALYSILIYMVASKTVDFFIEGVEEYTGITIVSYHSDEIREMITEKLGRGVTIYQGKRGFGKRGKALAETDIVFTVITRLEVSRLRTEVQKIDKNAFIIMHSIKDTVGGMIKKRTIKDA